MIRTAEETKDNKDGVSRDVVGQYQSYWKVKRKYQLPWMNSNGEIYVYISVYCIKEANKEVSCPAYWSQDKITETVSHLDYWV